MKPQGSKSTGSADAEKGPVRKDLHLKAKYRPAKRTGTAPAPGRGSAAATERRKTGADLKSRKEMHRALQEGEKRHQIILQTAMDGFWLTDMGGRLQEVNEAYCRMSGYTVSELLTMTISDLEVIESDADIAAHNRKIMANGLDRFESRHRRKDGTFFDVEVSSQHLSLQGGCFVSYFRDITEKKKAEKERTALEAQLQQAQKMECVGRLAGGVAHDFNNILGVIFGHLDFAMGNYKSSQPIQAHLEEIRKATERSADLTRQLLAFARKQTVIPRDMNLNEAVKGMLKMLRRLIGEDILLSWLPDPELWHVRIDPSQVDQLLINLCVNARDAIADVGNITIKTENIRFEEDAGPDNVPPGEYVMITVDDNGSGMAEETAAQIFEPFFTTKESGKGTGLGLSTVYGIVKQNGGHITVHSEPDAGTRFTLYFPRHSGDRHPELPEKTAPEPLGGKESILIVEDDPSALKVTELMLRKQGYSILSAKTPREALALAGETTGKIDLLITDVVLPDMNGRDLANALQALNPDLKCLFMSGYTADIIRRLGVLDPGVNFIQKPIASRDLAAKTREVLDHGKTDL